MRRFCHFIFIAGILSVLSCGKEYSIENSPPTTSGGLPGIWQLDSAGGISSLRIEDSSAQPQSFAEFSFLTNPASETGTVEFREDFSGNAQNLGYALGGMINAYLYNGGILIDSLQLPYAVPYASLPGGNFTYQLPAPDSLILSNYQLFKFPEIPGVPALEPDSSGPQGYRYRILNDHLFITLRKSRAVQVVDTLGASFNGQQSAQVEMRFVRH